MKTIGICNNKGGVGKTTICFCLAGALAEMGKKVLLVDMDQQGSLSSSLLHDINDLHRTITDALLDDRISIKEVIQKTDFENIELVPANLGLGKMENELISERDSHYYLADKLDEIKDQYHIILVDSLPTQPGPCHMVCADCRRWGNYPPGGPGL
jgi:chromosome partitioning protein